MRRRDFITLLGGAAAWPLAARAQQPALPVVGFLGRDSQEAGRSMVADFRKGLSETGYFEGQNVSIEYRWANSENERLPGLAADLIRRKVNVIVTGGTQAPLAVKALTTTIPIVFIAGVDPVRSGLVASLNRPGGNATGISLMGYEIFPKQLSILKDLLPGAERFGLLNNPTSTGMGPNPAEGANLREASAAIGRQIEVASARNIREIDTAFATLVQKKVEAVVISPNVLFIARRAQILTLAARYVLPTVFDDREAVVAGGLMSYGANAADATRQLGVYTGRILHGEKPSVLPVLQPTKFSLVINLSTARILGLTVPPTLLAIADEVIE
jgi:putative ABC transport system substrate-binding protein